MSPTTKNTVNEFRQQLNNLLSRLSDRDTESTAASSLTSLIPDLTPATLPIFISSITTTISSDPPSVLRHSLRLLSILSTKHPTPLLSPHLPLLLSSLLRLLPHPNSAVRQALVAFVPSLAPHFLPNSAPLFNALLTALSQHQHPVAQSTAALALAAAVDAVSTPDSHRFLPKLIKLYRSPAFKAKASLIAVLGAAAGAADGDVVACLVEALGSGDWAVRKAAAEALLKIGVARREILGEVRDSCLVAFEKRRYDKVKIVRETMFRMIDVWNDIPRAAGEDDAVVNSSSNYSNRDKTSSGRYVKASLGSGSVECSTTLVAKKNKVGSSRSPPPTASPVPAARKNARSIRNKISPAPVSQKNGRKIAGLRDGVAVFDAPVKVSSGGKKTKNVKEVGVGEGGIRAKLEARRLSFDKSSEENGNKVAEAKSVSHVLPLQESGTREIAHADDISVVVKQTGQNEGEISAIRMQLMQIENQQSSLMDLLQKFIGNSQNGIHSLETRVYGLEKAMNEISVDLISSRRMHNNSAANTCCKLPGAEFLRLKFWRKTEAKSSSRFSFSDIEKLTEKDSTMSFNWSKNKHGIPSEIITNPLAEINPPSRTSTDVSSNTVVKSMIYDAVTPARQL